MKTFTYNNTIKEIWSKVFVDIVIYKNKKYKCYRLNNNYYLLERGTFKKVRYVGRGLHDEIVNLQKQ